MTISTCIWLNKSEGSSCLTDLLGREGPYYGWLFSSLFFPLFFSFIFFSKPIPSPLSFLCKPVQAIFFFYFSSFIFMHETISAKQQFPQNFVHQKFPTKRFQLNFVHQKIPTKLFPLTISHLDTLITLVHKWIRHTKCTWSGFKLLFLICKFVHFRSHIKAREYSRNF